MVAAVDQPSVTSIRQHALQLLERLRQRDSRVQEMSNIGNDGDIEADYEIVDYRNFHNDGYETTSSSATTLFSRQFSGSFMEEEEEETADYEEGFTSDDTTDCYDDNDGHRQPGGSGQDRCGRMEAEDGEETRQQARMILDIVGDYGVSPQSAAASTPWSTPGVRLHGGEQRRRRRTNVITSDMATADSPSSSQPRQYFDDDNEKEHKPPKQAHSQFTAKTSTQTSLGSLLASRQHRSRHPPKRKPSFENYEDCGTTTTRRRLVSVVAGSIILAGIIYGSLL